jgi:hypothetical protein
MKHAVMGHIIRAAAICAVLAACGGQPIDPDNAAPRVADRIANQVEDQSMAEREISAPEKIAPAQQAAIDPASLVGMTGTRISSLFGDPIFVRRDPPGEFWRYRGKTCVLELFFYLRGDTQKVDHIETRASSGTKFDAAKCVATLRKIPAKT